MKKLTRSEEEIMQIIWDIGPCTVSQILDHMEQELQLSRPPHSTVSSIVRIIEDKGFLGHKAYGRTYEYHSLIGKDQYSRKNLRDLVRDYFDGSAKQLVSFLVREEELLPEEVADLLSKLGEDPPENSKK